MQSTTQHLDSFRIVGLARRQSNDHPDEIGKQWQAFFAGGGVKRIPNRKNDDVYALYIDYDGDYTKPYTMVIGCRVDNDAPAPNGLVTKQVPAAKYAVYDANGPQPQSVIATWKSIWESQLARTYTGDFDHYRGPDRVEIHVAVR